MPNKNLLQAAGDGTTVPAGYVGEVITLTNRVVSAVTTGYTANATALATLTTGQWLVFLQGFTTGNGTATSLTPAIATNSTNDGTGFIANDIKLLGANGLNVTWSAYGAYTATGSTPIYAKAQSTGGTINANISGFAVRIA